MFCCCCRCCDRVVDVNDVDDDPPGGTLPTRSREVRCLVVFCVCVCADNGNGNWRWLRSRLRLLRGERKVVALVAAAEEEADNMAGAIRVLVDDVVDDVVPDVVLDVDLVVCNNGEAINPAETSANAPNQQKIVRLVDKRRC